MPTARTQSQSKYDQAHTRRFGLKLNNVYDADIIAMLESQESMQAYIKQLIRADIDSKKTDNT